MTQLVVQKIFFNSANKMDSDIRKNADAILNESLAFNEANNDMTPTQFNQWCHDNSFGFLYDEQGKENKDGSYKMKMSDLSRQIKAGLIAIAENQETFIEWASDKDSAKIRKISAIKKTLEKYGIADITTESESDSESESDTESESEIMPMDKQDIQKMILENCLSEWRKNGLGDFYDFMAFCESDIGANIADKYTSHESEKMTG